MVGTNLTLLAPPGGGIEDLEAMTHRVEGKAHTYEAVCQHAEGYLVEVSITAVPEFDAAGRCIGTTKFVRNISERVELARQREVSATHARRMYESTPAMLHSVDREGRLMAVSDRWLAVLGYEKSEVIGRFAFDLLTPESRERSLREVLPKIFAEGHVEGVEYQIITRDGRVLDVLLSATLQRDDNGVPLNSLSIMEDVTERRRAERELAHTRHDLRQVLDAVPSMIGYWDSGLANRMANLAYSKWFGVDPEHLRGRHMRELLGDELFERNRPFVDAALRGEPQRFEREVQRPDGKGVRHSLANYIPDVVEGEVRGFYVLVHDVTELVESRLRLAAAQRQTEALLGTLHQHSIVSITDRKGRIVEVNEAFCTLSGYSREELIGQDHRLVNSGRQSPGFWTDMWRTVSKGVSWRAEVCNRAKDGSLYWVSSIIAPFMDAQGKVEKYISIRSDITAAKLSEERLLASEAFLSRAGQLAGVGAWEVDLRQQTVHWSAQTRLIHDVAPDYEPQLAEAINFYAPSARPVIQAAVDEAMARGTSWDLELPFITAKGRELWVRTVGGAENEDGQAVRLVGAFQDITERKQAEVALLQERQMVTSLLESLPDQIYFKDRNSRFLRINPALARRFGLADSTEAIGKSDADFLNRDQAHKNTVEERRIIESGQPLIDLEEQELWPDRPPTWTLTTKMPLRDSNGQIVGTFGISRDITARRQMETAILETNERFQLAASSVGIGVWEYDLSAGSLVWDDRMYELYGCSRASEKAPYTLWSESLHPADRARCERESQAAIEGIRPFDTTFRVITPDGSVRHIKAAAHVMRDAQGRPQRMIGVNFDVTERALLDAELSGTVTMLSSVLNAATEASIIATDCDGLITLFNRGAQRLLGYEESEVVGKLSPAVFHLPEEIERRCAELSAEYHQPIAGFQAFVHKPTSEDAETRRWTYVTKDGEHVSVMLTVTAVRDSQNFVVGYLGLAHDVRLEEQQARQLRQAVHEAKRANHAKSVFLSNMSHEIRTPMNAVIGVSYLLERTELNTDQADLVGKIKVAGKSLLGIINNVLDLSKIEALELTLEDIPFDMNVLLQDAYSMASVQAQAKGIGFTVDASPRLSPRVGDSTRLQQVLTNLINNAIKFTERGQVTLSVREQTGADAKPQLRFAVRDSGIGIAPDVLERLFQPFTQADPSTTRRFGGTGLGLSVVKQLVELMGGRVGVNSTEGVGSEFWVELELPRCEARELTVSSSLMSLLDAQSHVSGLPGVRILVVDDSSINCEVARRILELHGAKVSLASNGQEAVERLLDAPQGFDVVLMDVQMPVLDGLDATRRIRSGLGIKRLPIIALTAGALGAERQSAELAGMDDFVSKPFEPEALVSCIRRHVTVSPHPPAATQALAKVDETYAVDWPYIEGVDIEAAQRRMGGDLALFTSLLQRLLHDFADLGPAVWQASGTPQAVKASVARLHDLKGTAGTLGAVTVQQLATQAEQLARAGQAEQLDAALLALQRQLGELAHHAEPALATARNREEVRLTQAVAPLETQALQQLLQMLDTANIVAGAQFHALAPALRDWLGAQAFDMLRAQIESLQYDDASVSLQAAMQKLR
jgi:PAS domain S-box-containing protein